MSAGLAFLIGLCTFGLIIVELVSTDDVASAMTFMFLGISILVLTLFIIEISNYNKKEEEDK